jgi:hypothetical protein
MLTYDPLTFGTPLPLLQIPQQAIKDVVGKLAEPKASVGQYTQDCKSIGSLKAMVGSTDYSCARESTVDVGYICKKCQMVYPAEDACMSHQRSFCFLGTKIPDNMLPILKLEQIQYECRLCTDKFSTVQEYKSHCKLDTHKARAAKLVHRSSSSSSHRSSSSSATVAKDHSSSSSRQTVLPSVSPQRHSLPSSSSGALSLALKAISDTKLKSAPGSMATGLLVKTEPNSAEKATKHTSD